MKEACEQMREDYVVKNDCAIDQIWIRGDKNEMAKSWLKRLLFEFSKEHSVSDRETLVVEVDDWGEQIKKVSSDLKICCEMRKMPDFATGQRLVVVGLNEQSVRSKIAEMERDIQRSFLRARQQKQETQDDFDRRFRLAQSSKEEWNVGGEWDISCPYIEQEWGSEDQECCLKIGFTQPIENGLVQIYASFDFIAYTGIFRFVNPGALEDGPKKTKTKKKPTLDDHGSTSAQFLFPRLSLPSSNTRKFDFRWRGEETGEGQIQLHSDEKLCSITFESPNALSGVFISNHTGKVEFRGIRRESETQEEATGWLDPGNEWSSRNDAAYESARTGRWG